MLRCLMMVFVVFGVSAQASGQNKSENLSLSEAPQVSKKVMEDRLFDAARMGRTDVIDALLQLGTNVNTVSEKGYSALILAAYAGQSEAVSNLLAAGADACFLGPRGNTALMGAVFKGHADVVKRLNDTAGCTVDSQSRSGQTALMMAALFGREDIARILVAAGADASFEDARGNSPISLAQSQGNLSMAQLLGGTQ